MYICISLYINKYIYIYICVHVGVRMVHGMYTVYVNYLSR